MARLGEGRAAGARVRGLLAAGLLLGAILPGGGPAAAGEEAGPDTSVLRRIRELRGRAATLRVDGRAKDWDGFPFFEDRDPAPVADPSLDIASVAIAPRERDLLVLIETAAPPSRAPLAFGLDLEFAGLGARDAWIRFGASGAAEAAILSEGGSARTFPLPRLDVVVGEAVEVRVPMDLFGAMLGGETGRDWGNGKRRSFVRVQPWTAAAGSPARVDDGPAAASFRLVAPPLDLDPPLEPGGEPKRSVRLPLEGKWFVRQGANGLWSHQGLQAYDLAIEDHSLQPARVPGSRRLDDYYSWGKPVLAPEDGTVVFDSAPAEDRAPLEAAAGKSGGNNLIVRLADGLRLSFCHLQKGSAAYSRGGTFAAGALLARVGNSGDSGAPHLHLSLHEKPGEFIGLPLAFKEVRVGLNPGPDDPWARNLPSWAIREGWFVEPR